MKKLLLSVFCCLLVFSCSKEEDNITNTDTVLGDVVEHSVYTIEPLSAQELKCFEVSKALSFAMEDHPQLISLIRSEVNKQVYGDFEVLLSTIAKRQLPFSPKGQESMNSVGELLNFYLLQGELAYLNSSFKSSQNVLGAILQEFPLLSISVPILQDELDETTSPLVVLNRGLETAVTHIGFDSGDTVYLSASVPPSEPIFALGLSERAPLQSGALQTELFDLNMPFTNESITLSTSTSTNGITLDWSFNQVVTSGANLGVQGYYIYRLGGTSSSPVLAAVVDNQSTIYEDQDIYPLTQYTYFVKAFNTTGESSPSNNSSSTSGTLPIPPNNFEADILMSNQSELRWNLDNTQPYQGLNVYRKVVSNANSNSSYSLLHTEPVGGSTTFSDNTLSPSRVHYKVNTFNGLGESNSLHDFVVVPHRNVVQFSPVRIKKLYFPNSQLSSLEGWLGGKPEFKLHIVLLNNDGSIVTLHDEVKIDFSNRTNYYNCNVLIHNWLPANWMEKIMIHVEEYNHSLKGFKDLTISAGFNKKDVFKTGLELGASVEIDIINFFKKGNTTCGEGYLNYTAQPLYIIEFPNYGVKVDVNDQ